MAHAGDGSISRVSYQDELPGPAGSGDRKTKELITDQLGVALASSTLSWNRKVLEYVRIWESAAIPG